METNQETDLSDSERQEAEGRFLWAGFGDADSGSATNGAIMASEIEVPPTPEWPWRHLVHVADTIPLTENRLRYYDHPVIKVLAIWRELSWYELFTEGQELMNASRVASRQVATTLDASGE